MHLGDVCFWVEIVAFLEGPSQTRRQIFGDRRLAGAGHAHDHQDRRTTAMSARAVESADAGCIGDEDRIGAADEEAAFNNANDAPDALLKARRVSNKTEGAVENAIAAVRGER